MEFKDRVDRAFGVGWQRTGAPCRITRVIVDVECTAAMKLLLHRVRQCIECPKAVAKECPPTLARDVDRVQHGRYRGYLEVGLVTMEIHGSSWQNSGTAIGAGLSSDV